MATDSTLLQQSWLRAARRTPRLVPSFLDTLGWRYPSAHRLVHRLFGRGADVDTRVDAFAKKLALHIDDPAWLGAAFAMLTASHPEMTDVPPHIVGWIRDVLFETLEEAGGSTWTLEERAAWDRVLESTRERVGAHSVRRMAS
jgi:hypothetical protein